MPEALQLDVESKWVVRQLRETGRTQAELARYLNLTPPQINKTLKGKRKIQDREADLIREFFRVAESALPQPSISRPPPLQLVDSNVSVPLRSEMSRSLPIYGSVSAGGRLVSMKKPVDYAMRPRRLDGRDDVFALYVDDAHMSPAFEPGHLVLMESARPPAPGDNVVVQLKSETPGGDDETVIKRLVSIDEASVQLKQHNPPRQFDIPRERVERIFRVMTIGDLLTG